MVFIFAELQVLHGLLARQVIIRVFMLGCVFLMLPFIHFGPRINPLELIAMDHYNHFPGENFFLRRYLKPLYGLSLPEVAFTGSPCEADINLTSNLFTELMGMNLLKSGAKALCVGYKYPCALSALNRLGFSNVVGLKQCSWFSSLTGNCLVEMLPLENNLADFIFSSGFHMVSIPAAFVLEIERALKPCGVGAMLIGVSTSTPGSLVRAASHISCFLKTSKIVHVSMVESFAWVVFKKAAGYGAFEHYRLPVDCPSLADSRPYVAYLEPILEEKLIEPTAETAYLTKFMNISHRRHLLYIDIGAGSFAESSIAKWFLPSYPMQSRTFEIYAVDHNSSVLLSYAGKHGITFIYYPELSQSWVTADTSVEEEVSSLINDDDNDDDNGDDDDDLLEAFDFLDWFRKTVSDGDFVVMKLSTHGIGLKLLHELLKSGLLCLAHEIFLQCTNMTDVQDSTGGNCFQLFHALRSMGIFVHRLQ